MHYLLVVLLRFMISTNLDADYPEITKRVRKIIRRSPIKLSIVIRKNGPIFFGVFQFNGF